MTRMARRVKAAAMVVLTSALLLVSGVTPRAEGAPPRLRVDATGRGFETVTGQRFVYMADTAWGLLTELSSTEATTYLKNRSAKGMTVIQMVAAWDLCAGFRNCDPARPIASYWKKLDGVVTQAEGLGLYVALLPIWGTAVENGRVDAVRMEAYGRFLGARYRQHPLIWIIGGDTIPAGFEATWRALARGIAIGQNGTETYANTLMTFHPRPYFDGSRWYGSSAYWFANEPWLSFTMLQTGHCLACVTYPWVEEEYARMPVRPVITGEPAYEHIPDQLTAGNPLITADDVERFAYEATFAGAPGHAYGANEVYGFWNPGDPAQYGYDVWGASVPWPQALDFPGASRMGLLRGLLAAYPGRVPAPSVLLSPNPWGQLHVGVTRAANGDFVLAYVPDGSAITIDTGALRSPTASCAWWSPRDGASVNCGTTTTGARVFTPPTLHSWVLVLKAQ